MREKNPDTDFIPIWSKGNKHIRIIFQSGFIKENFVFLHPDEYEYNSDYYRFMQQITKYLKEGQKDKDDAPDSIAGASKYIRVYILNK
jgi:hypothetical protein